MTVLRYPGGKSRAVKHLEPYIPKDTEILLSPFFGGGSVEFHLSETRPHIKVKANDAYEPLYNFYNQLKENRETTIDAIVSVHPFSKEMFAAAQQAVLDKSNEPAERAAYYFALNRSSFSGATCSGGYSEQAATGRFTESSIQRCQDLNLTQFEFTNLQFAEFLQNNPPKPRTFIYLDPPYYLEKGSKLYGTKGDMHEGFDHTLLAEILRNRSDWVLSYNNCAEITKLYEFAKFQPASWSYGMNKSKTSSEGIIRPSTI